MRPGPGQERARKTQARLRDALLQLVTENPYESITVQDILDRARVGRSSFYAHFSGKRDLLLSGMDPLREELLRGVRKDREAGREPLAFSSQFFRLAAAYRQSYAALSEGDNAVLAQQKLAALVRDVVGEDVTSYAAGKVPQAGLDAISEGITGTLMGVVAWWVQQPETVTPEDGDRIFSMLAVPGLKAALSR